MPSPLEGSLTVELIRVDSPPSKSAAPRWSDLRVRVDGGKPETLTDLEGVAPSTRLSEAVRMLLGNRLDDVEEIFIESTDPEVRAESWMDDHFNETPVSLRGCWVLRRSGVRSRDVLRGQGVSADSRQAYSCRHSTNPSVPHCPARLQARSLEDPWPGHPAATRQPFKSGVNASKPLNAATSRCGTSAPPSASPTPRCASGGGGWPRIRRS